VPNPNKSTVCSGLLRHCIEYQTARKARTGLKGYVDKWTTQRQVRALVEPLGGVELLSSQQVDPRITHRITMRYFVGLESSGRFLFKGRIFNIMAPPRNVMERNRKWVVMCMEQTD